MSPIARFVTFGPRLQHSSPIWSSCNIKPTSVDWYHSHILPPGCVSHLSSPCTGPTCCSHPRDFSFAQFYAAPFTASPRKRRWASTSANQFDRLRRPMHWWREETSSNDKRIVYAASGAAVATLGWLFINQKSSQYPDDPRDLKELSTVPFSKLFSGWM